MQPADDRRGRADLLYKRGLALRSLGRWEEALADWREALAAYEELGDAEAVGRVCTDYPHNWPGQPAGTKRWRSPAAAWPPWASG